MPKALPPLPASLEPHYDAIAVYELMAEDDPKFQEKVGDMRGDLSDALGITEHLTSKPAWFHYAGWLVLLCVPATTLVAMGIAVVWWGYRRWEWAQLQRRLDHAEARIAEHKVRRRERARLERAASSNGD